MAKPRVIYERKKCMVCAKKYRTEAVLITHHPPKAVQWGMCPTHARLRERNLIALVEVDPAKSTQVDDEHMTPDQAHRTGTVIYMGRNLFGMFFDNDPPDDYVAYVTPDLIASLQRFKALHEGNDQTH